MIKNLITALGMTLIYTPSAAAMIPDTATNTIQTNTSATVKDNIFTQNSYYEEDLDTSIEVATINYEDINLTNVVNVKARAKIKTYRYILDDEYHIEYNLLIAVNNQPGITLVDNDFTINWQIPLSNLVDLTSGETYYRFGYYNNLDATQLNFLNGTTYNSYDDLNDYDPTPNTGANTIESDEPSNLNPLLLLGENYNYYYFDISIYYNVGVPTNGTDLLNNKDIIKNLNYKVKYSVQINPTQYEVIDLPGLMFEILGMPFAWLSIAFNFTLFPGTPYAINISHILLGLLVSLIAIIIFRLVMKGK